MPDVNQDMIVILELGCGKNKWNRYKEVSIGIDFIRVKGVDVIADLSRGIPVRSSSVDKIIAFSILEHLRDPIRFMRECHRVLKLNGELLIKTPSPRDKNAWADPTHVRPYPKEAFEFFLCSHEKNYYFGFCFRSLKFMFDNTTRIKVLHGDFLGKFLGRHPLIRSKLGYQIIYVLKK